MQHCTYLSMLEVAFLINNFRFGLLAFVIGMISDSKYML